MFLKIFTKKHLTVKHSVKQDVVLEYCKPTLLHYDPPFICWCHCCFDVSSFLLIFNINQTLDGKHMSGSLKILKSQSLKILTQHMEDPKFETRYRHNLHYLPSIYVLIAIVVPQVMLANFI